MTTFQQADIVHDVAITISPLVRRITASNSGVMTGPGTNTYIVGREQLAVIDPGPADAAHIEAILKTCGDRLRWILTTHTHPDHSPAAVRLAEVTGAEVLGNLITDDGRQDTSFNPARGFAHDELFVTDEFRLRAIATPGHVGNHLCFLLEDEGLLFTGDHIMQGSTVVIVPPNGDMQDYLNSLSLLLNYSIAALAPAHGQIMLQAQAEIKMLIKHRLLREARAASALQNIQRGTLDEITPLAYSDVNPELHRIARYSLWAHLLKLQKEGKAAEENGEWRWLPNGS
jgi:glyoxylase-like metal-dependent hydrolase (beta-lactamase superfamily II)